MNSLNHFNQQGEAHMVDVGDRSVTHHVARCAGGREVRLQVGRSED